MKEKIKVNTDAGNVEAGVAAFNAALGEDISYQQERQDYIDRLESKGYHYNWSKFSNPQLYRMATEKPARTKRKVETPISNNKVKRCSECNTQLTDGGYCPVCDDGEEHLNEYMNTLEDNMKSKFTISYEKLPVVTRSNSRIVGGFPGYPEWDETNDEVDFDLVLSEDEVIETILEIDPDLTEREVEANIQEMFENHYQRIKSMWEHDAIKLAQIRHDEAPEDTEWDVFAESFEESEYTRVASKTVTDSDGFRTDYTWYKDAEGNNIFIFGDNEIYTPDNSEPDWEEENDEAAQEWFDSYTGFDDEILDEATDVGVTRTYANSDRLYHREHKGDAADNIMEFQVNGKVISKNDGRYVVYDKLGSDAKLFVNFDIDGPVTEYRFTVDGVEHVCGNSIEAAKIINDALHAKRFSTFDIPMDEAWERDYNLDEWNEDDIELHKSIDWRARDYRDYPVPEDSIIYTATAYGLPGGTQRKSVKFIKYIRANELFPPYYGVEEIPFEGVLSGMYDGDRKGKYMIMNRFETQEVYDALSESVEDSSTKDFKEGDVVYVKPSKKSGRVVSVKDDVVEVEIDGGKDPDRRDRFYASDLEKEDSLTEDMNTYNVTFYMDSLDDNVMSGPSTTKIIHAGSEEEAEKKLIDSSTDKYYIPTIVKIEQINEAYVENPREFKHADEDGFTFDEETGKRVKIDYDENGEPVEVVKEAIEMTADEMKAKHGTDNPDIINAGKPEEERVALKEQMTYTDTNGFLGEPGEKYTMSQFRRMWQDKDNDPSMSAFASFEEWVGETISHMDAHEETDVAPSGRGKLSCAIFIDTTGIMGEPSAKYTVNDLADYWTANRGSDPVLAAYEGDWKKWLDDTIEQMEVGYDSCLFDESLHEDANDPRSWSDDKELTYEDALALAKAYYAQGGDGFYETADKDYFDYLVKEYGPQTVKMMKQSFGTFDAVAKDRMSQ